MGAVSGTQILLYVPNLIGYVRIVLALISFCVAVTDPITAFWCYAASYALDAADGFAARALNQGSRFGAVLDMITDRFSSAGLLVVLSHLYPEYLSVWICLIALDLCSHYFRMYSSLLLGSTSHKSMSGGPWLLQIYYKSRFVLTLLVTGNEAFFVLAYTQYFFSDVLPEWQLYGLMICAPICFVKQLINVIQLVQAAKDVVNHEVHESRKSS